MKEKAPLLKLGLRGRSQSLSVRPTRHGGAFLTAGTSSPTCHMDSSRVAIHGVLISPGISQTLADFFDARILVVILIKRGGTTVVKSSVGPLGSPSANYRARGGFFIE